MKISFYLDHGKVSLIFKIYLKSLNHNFGMFFNCYCNQH